MPGDSKETLIQKIGQVITERAAMLGLKRPLSVDALYFDVPNPDNVMEGQIRRFPFATCFTREELEAIYRNLKDTEVRTGTMFMGIEDRDDVPPGSERYGLVVKSDDAVTFGLTSKGELLNEEMQSHWSAEMMNGAK